MLRYQAVQNLLPDALLMIGGNTFVAPLLNSCKPVSEGVHVAWRSAFAFQSCHFVSPHATRFIFPQLLDYGKVVAK